MTLGHDPTAQPVGPSVDGWTERPPPPRTPMRGAHCAVVPLDPGAHARDLYRANDVSAHGTRNWTYLFAEPPTSFEEYRAWLEQAAATDDPLFHAVIKRDGSACGVAAFMRIDRANGTIEIGHINFSPLLQRTTAATEALYLMMKRAFDLGYRRCEWKCDDLNAPSKAAAERLGFRYEGLFRQAVVYKGRNRDTAWYAITDGEWPFVERALASWFRPENFDATGRERRSLREHREALVGREGLEPPTRPL